MGSTPSDRVNDASPPTSHDVTWEFDGIIVKRYRTWLGREAEREWTALNLLHRYAPGLAPEPVDADLTLEPPVVRMRHLDGETLGGRPLTAEQLEGIGLALDRMHSAVPTFRLRDLAPSRSEPASSMSRLHRRLIGQPRPTTDRIVGDAFDAAVRWFDGPGARALSADTPPPVLARGDHNLTNFLWSADGVRLLDFEDSGRGDHCSELAELVEHISARTTPDAAWDAFLAQQPLDRDERRRLTSARQMSAIFWLVMLLPGQPGHHRNPPDALIRQANRLLSLCR